MVAGTDLNSPPPNLAGIEQVASLKILGVTISNKLSVSEHVQQTASRRAQSFHALLILRNHGMEVNALQLVFKSVLLGKMTYAVSAWSGYNTGADKQRLKRRVVRVGLYPADGPNLHQFVTDMDDAVFARIHANERHVIIKTKTGFMMAAVRHLGFSKVANFNFRSHSETQYASLYQISRRSVKPFRRYGRYSIFQDGGGRHLGFWKFQIFNG